MDIYRFINSKDVAAHLKEIGYEFTMPEAAFLIYQSRRATLEEKTSAWLEIANSMPDCGMAGRRDMEAIPSFRRFLHDYVALKEREVESFFEPDGWVFSGDYEGGGYGDELFGSAEGCIEYLRGSFDESDRFDSVTILKRGIDSPGHPRGGRLYLNRDFRVMDVDIYDEDEPDLTLSLQFEGMWFAFPTPFRRGDIVRDATSPDSEACVLNCLCAWDRGECLANGLPEDGWNARNADRLLDMHRKDGDTSDMWWDAYCMDDGKLQVGDCGPSYLDIERCDKLAEGSEWAEALSAYLKGRKRLDELLNLFRSFKTSNEG